MISAAVERELVPGTPLTVDELAERIGIPRAHVRAAVSEMVFQEKRLTCGRDGRFTLGHPGALLSVGG